MTMEAEQIARVVHEANRALQTEQADPTIPVSPARRSAVEGVRGVLNGASAEESHEGWTRFKVEHGWTLGPVKDEEKKEHPLLVPYDELPEAQRLKDSLFGAIVRVLGGKGSGDPVWLEGYEWALANLHSPGVLADAHRQRCKAEAGEPCAHLS